MRELLARIAADSDRTAGTTLVVGAGNGAELSILRGVGQRRLILVEPHPQCANELSARLSPGDGEEVWPLAIAPESTQQARLFVLSNLRYSSLCEPGRLLEHGPNLRKQAPIEVRALALAEAIETASLQPDANNLLILDAPGLGVELLRQTDASLIQQFAWVIVHASSLPELYRGELSHERGTERLLALGFVPVEEDPDALYPEVVTLYRRDDHRIEVMQQTSLAERLREELSEAREVASWRAQQHQQQLSELGAERDGLLQRLQTAEQANARLTQSNAEMTQERDAQARQLAELRDEIEQLRADRARLQEEKRALDTSREEQAKRGANELIASLDRAEQKLSGQQQRIDQLEYELTESSSRQRLLDEELVKAEAQLELVKDLLLREQTL